MRLDQWMGLAKQRARIILTDGREGRLIAVRKNARSCKVQVGGRHYNCWADDIAFIEDLQRPVNDSAWHEAEPWKVRELHDSTTVRLLRAAPSGHWLSVVVDRQLMKAPRLPPPAAD